MAGKGNNGNKGREEKLLKVDSSSVYSENNIVINDDAIIKIIRKTNDSYNNLCSNQCDKQSSKKYKKYINLVRAGLPDIYLLYRENIIEKAEEDIFYKFKLKIKEYWNFIKVFFNLNKRIGQSIYNSITCYEISLLADDVNRSKKNALSKEEIYIFKKALNDSRWFDVESNIEKVKSLLQKHDKRYYCKNIKKFDLIAECIKNKHFDSRLNAKLFFKYLKEIEEEVRNLRSRIKKQNKEGHCSILNTLSNLKRKLDKCEVQDLVYDYLTETFRKFDTYERWEILIFLWEMFLYSIWPFVIVLLTAVLLAATLFVPLVVTPIIAVLVAIFPFLAPIAPFIVPAILISLSAVLTAAVALPYVYDITKALFNKFFFGINPTFWECYSICFLPLVVIMGVFNIVNYLYLIAVPGVFFVVSSGASMLSYATAGSYGVFSYVYNTYVLPLIAQLPEDSYGIISWLKRTLIGNEGNHVARNEIPQRQTPLLLEKTYTPEPQKHEQSYVNISCAIEVNGTNTQNNIDYEKENNNNNEYLKYTSIIQPPLLEEPYKPLVSGTGNSFSNFS